MSDMGVYRITHCASGRTYIGSSIHCAERWRSHQVRLNCGIHNNPKLQAAWAKYGADAFCFAIVETVTDKSQLIVREQWYLDTEQPWYNVAPMASNPMLGRKRTAEHTAAIHAARIARGGYRVAPEQRARIAATLRGRSGYPKDEDVRQRIAQKLRGHPVSEVTRAKISARVKGYRHTDEARRKIGASSRERMKGNTHGLGHKHSVETKAKMSAARRATLAAGRGIRQPSIRPCSNCGCASTLLVKGRCRTCYEYWRTHGRLCERPCVTSQ